MRSALIQLAAVCCVCHLAGAVDAQELTGGRMTIVGESLVLAATESANLCFDRVVKGSLVLRSTFVAGRPDTLSYIEGKDYAVDYEKGTVRRMADSRIPDYSTHWLYEQAFEAMTF